MVCCCALVSTRYQSGHFKQVALVRAVRAREFSVAGMLPLELSLNGAPYKQFVYDRRVIKNFAHTETERLFLTGKSRRLPPDILRRGLMRLTQLHAATVVDDLRMPPSNRLEALSGDRVGQWSIRINDQWRVCFRFEAGHALDVEITDYH